MAQRCAVGRVTLTLATTSTVTPLLSLIFAHSHGKHRTRPTFFFSTQLFSPANREALECGKPWTLKCVHGKQVYVPSVPCNPAMIGRLGLVSSPLDPPLPFPRLPFFYSHTRRELGCVGEVCMPPPPPPPSSSSYPFSPGIPLCRKGCVRAMTSFSPGSTTRVSARARR
jgi:hypothetical protein